MMQGHVLRNHITKAIKELSRELSWCKAAIRISFFLALTVFRVHPAHAQDFISLIKENYNRNVSTITSGQLSGLQIQKTISQTKTEAITGAGSRTTYSPSPQVTKALRDNLVAGIRARDPKSGDALAKEFQKNDFVKEWQGVVSRYDLKPNDVADSLTAFLLLAWVEVNNDKSNYNNDAMREQMRQQVHGLHGQMKTALSATPSFGKLSDAKRQQLSEALMLQFLVQYATAQKARRSDEGSVQKKQSQQVTDALHTQIKQSFGLDLRTVTLSKSGFRATP